MALLELLASIPEDWLWFFLSLLPCVFIFGLLYGCYCRYGKLFLGWFGITIIWGVILWLCHAMGWVESATLYFKGQVQLVMLLIFVDWLRTLEWRRSIYDD